MLRGSIEKEQQRKVRERQEEGKQNKNENVFFNIFVIKKIAVYVLCRRVSRAVRLPTRYNMCPLYKTNHPNSPF